jgi:hypothetical protein
MSGLPHDLVQEDRVPLVRITTCGQLTIAVLQAGLPGTDSPPIYAPPEAALLARKSTSTALTLLALLASRPHSFAPKDWLSEKLGQGREDDDLGGMKRVDNVVSLLRSLLSPPQPDDSLETSSVRRRLVEYQRASGESGPSYRLAGPPLV